MSRDLFAEIGEALTLKGYAVLESVFSPGELGEARDLALRLFDEGELSPGGVAGGRKDRSIRSDFRFWVDTEGETSPVELQALLGWVEGLRKSLNEKLHLGLWDFECHLAVYPEGGFYARHLDRFKGDDRRVVSLIVYLNEPHWSPEDGGELVLYLPEGPQRILPSGGKVVCFLSEEIEHEVLAARKPRVSFTGWLRRR